MRVGSLNRYVALSQKPVDSTGQWTTLDPPNAWCSIAPNPGAGDGRTTLHTVQMRFHPQVTVDTQLLYSDPVLLRDRSLMVMDVTNVKDGNYQMTLICQEIAP